jgi:hypothetical protein
MEIENVRTYDNGFIIEWSKEGIGFGELSFKMGTNGYELDSEHMGEEFCKEIFDAFIKKYLKIK